MAEGKEGRSNIEPAVKRVVRPLCQEECLLDVPSCDKVSSNKYWCSRTKGHPGKHVACGSKCEIEAWD